jgi:hypothetical protein
MSEDASLGSFSNVNSSAQQLVARETAAKLYRSFAVESGDVNPEVSFLSANRDGSVLKLPNYTAIPKSSG